MERFRDPFAELREIIKAMRVVTPAEQIASTRAKLLPPAFVSQVRSIQEQIRPLALGFQQLQEQFRGPIIAAETSLRAIMESMKPHVPAFIEFARALKEHARWIEEAPQKLKQAFADAGMVPHPDLSLPDLRELIAEFETHGADAAVTLLVEKHEELLAHGPFRKDLQERWEAAGRWAVLSQVLAALDAKLYAVAVPAALAQVDGIVAELFGLTGLRQDALKARVAELHDGDSDDLYFPLVEAVLEALLGKFEHGAPTARLNRHAVLHGADTSYGTRVNAITAITWVDYVLLAAQGHARERTRVFRAQSLRRFRPLPDTE